MTAATAKPLRRARPPVTPAGPMTAEEFIRLPDTRGRELVRGFVQEVPVPGFVHGFVHGVVCADVSARLLSFVRERDLGRVLSNDSHLQVPTSDGADTVRGMDVSFFSWNRVPRESRPVYLPPNPPELVIEVRSPSDRRGVIVQKVGEYLARGVDVVAVGDPDRPSLTVYRGDDPPDVLNADDSFVPGAFLPGFEIAVGELLRY